MSLFGLMDDDRMKYVEENDALLDRLGLEIEALQELTHKHGQAIDLQIGQIRKRLTELAPRPETDI